MSPVDEFQYWGDLSKRDERAATYVDLFKPVSKDFGGLDAMSLQDVMELVDITQDALDDVWKCIEYDLYPEPRMKHFMDVIGNKFICIPPLEDWENKEVGFILC